MSSVSDDALQHWRDVASMTDSAWHLHPLHPHEFCGGCGFPTEECHADRCCTEVPDRLNYFESVCGLCSTRKLTGQVRP